MNCFWKLLFSSCFLSVCNFLLNSSSTVTVASQYIMVSWWTAPILLPWALFFLSLPGFRQQFLSSLCFFSFYHDIYVNSSSPLAVVSEFTRISSWTAPLPCHASQLTCEHHLFVAVVSDVWWGQQDLWWCLSRQGLWRCSQKTQVRLYSASELGARNHWSRC